jgi:hypothetical protein
VRECPSWPGGSTHTSLAICEESIYGLRGVETPFTGRWAFDQDGQLSAIPQPIGLHKRGGKLRRRLVSERTHARSGKRDHCSHPAVLYDSHLSTPTVQGLKVIRAADLLATESEDYLRAFWTRQ